ncbi:MAG: hypothetical protein C5B59_14210 [Bacteroidetes bacterium]|nr:MAG: hypothetical protein C5B59_14210 [Bacteroidota bacterium]
MFRKSPLNGSALPSKTISLTFDDGPGETIGDGPGPKTIKLATYLHDQEIRAAFFEVGKFIEKYPHIPPAVASLGHIIGNHTYSHPNMPRYFESGGDCLFEIANTTRLMSNVVSDKKIYFRAPYGDWNQRISESLNRDLDDGIDYQGPYGWDIACNDSSFWEKGLSAQECADIYLAEILQKESGIVLMHDSTADFLDWQANNRTYESILIIVPKLKALGYKFVGLDEIPDGS